MHLGVDLGPFRAARTGIPVYARELLGAIRTIRPDWRFSGFALSGWTEMADALDRPRDTESRRSAEDIRARLTGLALSLPLVSRARLELRRRRFETAATPDIDLFHALNFLPPGEIDRPVVPVVHDLYHLEPGAFVHPARRHALAGLGDVVARAPRVQAVSQFTAERLVRHFGVAPDRVDLVPPSLRAFFLQPAEMHRLAGLDLQAGRYWLAVGMGERRKNLDFLLDLFSTYPELCTPEFPLALAGPPAWQASQQAGRLQAMISEDRIRPLGFVADEALHALYAGAAALLMPSLHEGFGIPILEALASRTAVIAADNSAMPEASGGHALHLPLAPGAWAEAMSAMQGGIRDVGAMEAGRAHARSFTPEASARAAVASLERAL